MTGGGQEGLVDWTALLAQFKGREASVLRIAGTALQSQAEVPGKLRALAADRDYSELSMAAHSIKGMGGNLMATQVYDLAKRTDDAAREANPESLALAGQLARLMEALLEELGEKVRIGRVS